MANFRLIGLWVLLVIGCANDSFSSSDNQGTGGTVADTTEDRAVAGSAATDQVTASGGASETTEVGTGGQPTAGGATTTSQQALGGQSGTDTEPSCLLVMRHDCIECAKCWERSAGIAECARFCGDLLECWAAYGCTQGTCPPGKCVPTNTEALDYATMTRDCSCAD